MSTMTLDLPTPVRDEVSAAVEAGVYADEEAFVADAVRTLLAVRPDVRRPSPAGCMSLESIRWARRAEWSGLNVERMKLALHRRAIERTTRDAGRSRGRCSTMAAQAARQAPGLRPVADEGMLSKCVGRSLDLPQRGYR